MKNLSTLKEYLGSRPAAKQSFPFGPEAAVFKVKGKVFAIASKQDDSARVNLKCDPHEAQALRDVFESVKPGYHMNKKHWNTVMLAGDVPDGELMRMIDHSYALVVKGLKKSLQVELAAMAE